MFTISDNVGRTVFADTPEEAAGALLALLDLGAETARIDPPFIPAQTVEPPF